MSPADSPFAPLPAPGPHPAPAELRAYAAGTLGPAHEHRIEAHTLDCERCADVLAGFSMTDAATTDQAVAALRTRLQARLPAGEPAAAVRPLWPRLAAAAALLATAAAGLWTLDHRPPAATAPSARHEAAAPAPSAEIAATAPVTEIKKSPETKPVTASQPAAAALGRAVAAAPATQANGAGRPRRRRPSYAAGGPSRAARPAARPAPVAGLLAAAASSPAGRGTTEAQAADSTPAADALAAAPTPKAEPAADPTTESATESALPHKLATNSDLFAKSTAAINLRAADNAAAAQVLNTPMPAAFAIRPAPVGGTPALREYLRREALAFEPESPAPHLTGTVRVKFVVGPDGKVSNLKVVHGLRADYDAEAVRMVCDGPGWQPGIAGGRRAPLPTEVTISF